MAWWQFWKKAKEASETNLEPTVSSNSTPHPEAIHLLSEPASCNQHFKEMLNSRTYNSYLKCFDILKIGTIITPGVLLYFYGSPFLGATLIFRLAPTVVTTFMVLLANSLEKTCQTHIPTEQELTALQYNSFGEQNHPPSFGKKHSCNSQCVIHVGLSSSLPGGAGGLLAAYVDPLLGGIFNGISSVGINRFLNLWDNRKKMSLTAEEGAVENFNTTVSPILSPAPVEPPKNASGSQENTPSTQIRVLEDRQVLDTPYSPLQQHNFTSAAVAELEQKRRFVQGS